MLLCVNALLRTQHKGCGGRYGSALKMLAQQLAECLLTDILFAQLPQRHLSDPMELEER